MNVHILEMPDYGGRRHGSDMGPSAIRLAGLREKIESLGHNVFVNKKGFNIVAQEYADAGSNPKAKYLDAIVDACTDLAREVEAISDTGDFPPVLGGDHSIALGTLAGLGASYKKSGKRQVFFTWMHTVILTPQKLLLRETFTASVWLRARVTDWSGR